MLENYSHQLFLSQSSNLTIYSKHVSVKTRFYRPHENLKHFASCTYLYHRFSFVIYLRKSRKTQAYRLVL